MVQINTKLTHLGRATALDSHSVNPPLVRTSTTLFPDLAAFKNSYEGVTFEVERYGRSGTSTTFELQDAMATFCAAESCIAVNSGLAAITAVLSAHAAPGKCILIQEDTYAKTQNFIEKVLRAQGCRVQYFKTATEISQYIDDRTSLIFLEVPTSLTMKMIDVRAICALAHQHEIPVACDSTWGTPLFFDAHALGIDISIHSATKYINGHSDLLLGLVTGSYTALCKTRDWCDLYGTYAAPDVCWLALRGLRTLGIRMARHQENAFIVANWLTQQSEVKNIYFPVLCTDPGHYFWKEQFSGGAGPFTIEIQSCKEQAFESCMDALAIFGIGTSWGGFESLIMPAIPHHLRKQKTLPDEGRLLRLHIGLEDPQDLCDDLRNALNHISKQEG